MLERARAAIAALTLAAAAALWSAPASAQSACQALLTYGNVLTAGQWQSCFNAKQDSLGYTPVNKAGDVMLGKLATTPSTTSQAGFSILPGVAPLSPKDGDMWTTSAGLYVQIGGVTVGPLASGAAASFAATAPLGVSFPSGVTTYAINFDATLKNNAGSLGIDTAHANSWSNQTFASPTFTGTVAGAGTIPNSVLANSSITVNGTPCALGGSCSPTAAGVSSIDSQTGAFTTGTGLQSGGNTLAISSAWQTRPTTCAGFSGGVCPRSGSSLTYTTPPNTRWIEVTLCGGGGGGAGGGTSPGNGTGGGQTSWSSVSPALSWTAPGGGGGAGAVGGTGGTAGSNTGTFYAQDGANGQSSTTSVPAFGGNGGASIFGGSGFGGSPTAAATKATGAGSGGGGGGATASAGGGGGAAAKCLRGVITNLASSYTFTIGAKGPGGAAGGSGGGGNDGNDGIIMTIEHYGS